MCLGRYSGRAVISAVTLQRPRAPRPAAKARSNVTMPVLSDLMGTVAETFHVTSFPQTFIIADGKVEHVHVGTRSLHTQALRRQIDSLLSRHDTS